MKESNIQTIWGKYLIANPPSVSESHELKLSKTKSIRIDAVKVHQVKGLNMSKTGLYYKIQDMSAANGFANPKPFDNFWLINTIGYVVICFYILRQKKFVYKIPIDVWVRETEKIGKKSVKETEIASWTDVEKISL